ncbi:MAG: trypsin-like peptidase domain-containing protein [Phycisphaerae bacterium]|nr:trypsin-like peptidase domain-containing protein [Phycisphaerae bacterium]
MNRYIWMAAGWALCAQAHTWAALADADSPRRTVWVDLIRQAEPAVVAIVRQDAGGKTQTGTGTVIHESGAILTSDSVVQGQTGHVLIRGQSPIPYEFLGRLPEKDLALIRVRSNRAMVAVPLGLSHDLAAGEPILVGGNPGARGITFSSGMVGSASVAATTADALEMAGLQSDGLDRYIRFDAGTGADFVGGPLLNAEGLLVGVVTRKGLTQEDVHLATPIDRVRSLFYDLVAPEERGDFWTGVDVDLLAQEAVVIHVEPNGPGPRAGLRTGDRIASLYGRPVRDGPAWILSLVGRRANEALVLSLGRDRRPQQVTLSLQPYPVVPALSFDEGLTEGLWYAVFQGRFTTLPDFQGLEPIHDGNASAPQAADLPGLPDRDYALVFVGYVEIPKPGAYRLVLGSDGQSRLYLDWRATLDNKGPSPYQESSTVRRLSDGLHPMRIEYLQATAYPSLRLRIEPDSPSGGQPPIPLHFYTE